MVKIEKINGFLVQIETPLRDKPLYHVSLCKTWYDSRATMVQDKWTKDTQEALNTYAYYKRCVQNGLVV